jgi:hypothetical protein
MSETLSIALRQEHSMRMFESRGLRIAGLGRDEVTRRCRKLHKLIGL